MNSCCVMMVKGLLEKLASACILSGNRDRKVFFINNLDAMLNIFAERRIQCEEVQKFDELLLQQREQYVEEELMGCFPKLIEFVLTTERLMNARDGNGSTPGAQSRNAAVDESKVESLVSGVEMHNVVRFLCAFLCICAGPRLCVHLEI